MKLDKKTNKTRKPQDLSLKHKKLDMKMKKKKTTMMKNLMRMKKWKKSLDAEDQRDL